MLQLIRQGFKEKIREPGEADRFLRLMNINRVCHSVLCGQLERHFRGQTIFYMTCPGSALWKPYKSRLFSCLIVHTRPPFPFTFRFLPPVNSGGTVGTIFRPVGLWVFNNVLVTVCNDCDSGNRRVLSNTYCE